MAVVDQLYGRILIPGGTGTDAYLETQVSAPAVLSQNNKEVWVPVIKEVDFELYGSLSGLSADASLRCCLMAGDATLYSAWPSAGIADPNVIAMFTMANALTTSGEIIVDCLHEVVMPGDGLLLTANYMTLIQHNVATGVAMSVNCRVWYDYAVMDRMSYLTAIHGMS